MRTAENSRLNLQRAVCLNLWQQIVQRIVCYAQRPQGKSELSTFHNMIPRARLAISTVLSLEFEPARFGKSSDNEGY